MKEENAILCGKIEGDLTKNIAREYFKEVTALAKGIELKGLLTDVRSANLMACEEDMETLSQELSQLGLDDKMRRALVVREDVRDYKVWENHNFRAGYFWLRLFLDCERAEEWLVEQ